MARNKSKNYEWFKNIAQTLRKGEEYFEQNCKKLTMNLAKVVCGDVLRNESMKPSNLKGHITTEQLKRQTS
jgi:hypothetical protein